MIEFSGVGKTFTDSSGSVRALDGITLTVNDGDIFGVIGFSGAGKSTLVRMVNGLEQPTDGTVSVNGRTVQSYTGRELRAFRRGIGMIFQHFNLLESRTAAENIAVPLELVHTPKAKQRRRTAELLRFVELEDKANAYPSQLSGGQKQRIAIARALATSPSILLCDEATSALDPQTTESILALLRKVNRELGVTILIITHQMNVIQEVCNRVAVLEKGTVVEQGSVIDVFGSPQSEVTKGFIRTVINDRLPDEVKRTIHAYRGPQRILRLRFEGANANDPVMSYAVKTTGANISILYGVVTELQERIIGFQTVQITGTDTQIVETVRYLESSGVTCQEVEL